MEQAIRLLKDKSELSFITPEGGFFLTLTLEKQGIEEEEIACMLLEKHRILMHPGYFYDMEGNHLVLSFVSRPSVLQRALRAVIEGCR